MDMEEIRKAHQEMTDTVTAAVIKFNQATNLIPEQIIVDVLPHRGFAQKGTKVILGVRIPVSLDL